MAATAGRGGPVRRRAPTGGCRRWTSRHGRTPSEPPPRSVGAGAGERVTVTRAAAQRSREMGSKMYGLVHRAATADGADKSGLTALTWPVVANFAVDAAMAVALANTLVLRGGLRREQEQGRAVPVDHDRAVRRHRPADRAGTGPAAARPARRAGDVVHVAHRAGVVLIANYDGATGSFPSWVLYPCALGMMVLSKSFSVLRSAVTPRVLPPTIDLVRVNSRLTMFGLLGGTMVGGAIAAGARVPVQPVAAARGVVRRRRGHGRRARRCRCGSRSGSR